ncbi:hypothetical protein GCM10027174_12850 [Salinifilum aidingensis]
MTKVPTASTNSRKDMGILRSVATWAGQHVPRGPPGAAAEHDRTVPTGAGTGSAPGTRRCRLR